MRNNYQTYQVLFKGHEQTPLEIRARTRDEAVRKARKALLYKWETLKSVWV